MPPPRARPMGTDAGRWLVWGCVTACAPTVGGAEKVGGSGTSASTVPEAFVDSGDTASTEGPVEVTEACGLEVALEQRFYTEGDRVTFQISCTDGDIAGVVLSLAGGGEGLALDPSTGLVSWQTDGRSGGRYDVTVGASSVNGIESELVSFWVADAPDAPGAEAPEPLTYTEEWGLPVVHVQVDRGLSEEEQAATISVRDQQVTGSAKVRGASSVSYPKVSYTLDFESDELGVKEWGDRTREHMVLITSFDDNSYVRQKLGYDLWMAMAEHAGDQRLTPRTFFAVVYINGVYQGLYTACDRIDDEFLRHMGTDGEGSLYKAVSHDANFYLTDAGGRAKSWLSAGYDKKEGNPDDWSDMDALVAYTGSASDDQLWNEHPGLELEEFADWLLWAQLILAQDSAGKNAYLYADPVAGRWRFAPWDLNDSFGQNWYTLRVSSTERNDYYWNNRIFRMLQEHPDAQAMVRARFSSYREGGPFEPAALGALLDGYLETLGPNVNRDWARWGAEYQSFGRWSWDRSAAGDWTTPSEEVDYVRSWLNERLAMYDAEGPI